MTETFNLSLEQAHAYEDLFVPALFADWVGSLQELYAGYTDEQLEVILHFLDEAARRQREATARLTE